MHLFGKWLLVIAILGFGLLTVDSFQNRNICGKRRLLINHKTLSKSCGLNHPQVRKISRIIGGKNAVAGQFPYAAQLIDRGQHTCGCTIINSRYLLTAAHCLQQRGIMKDAYSMTVNVGSFFFNSQNKRDCSTEYRIRKFYAHPSYMTESKNDIGIIELEKPINFGYYDKGFGSNGPICLQGNLKIRPGTFLRLAGWGDTNNGPPRVLQFDDYEVINCSEANSGLARLGDSIICTKTDTRFKSDYKGDSGSGLFAFVKTKNGKFVAALVGIVNRGMNRLHGYEKGSIFARVNYYKDWIEQVTRQRIFG